ncbi:MAG: hypothetical protein AB7N24_21275 [Dehalococcoidia bacterium]
MQVLRLGNSYEHDPNIPPEANKSAVADRLLSEAVGEPVETTSRVIWPDPGLPDLIDKWIERYQPDLVLLVVTSYWFTHVSLPLAIERRFGRIGKPIARTGDRLVHKPWLAKNRAFNAARQVVRGTIGGETNFTPEQVIEAMETCVRRILSHEDVALAVRGPRIAFATEGSEKAKRVAEERRSRVDHHMAEFCRQLHIEYIAYDTGVKPDAVPEEFQTDGVHVTAAVHAQQGKIEGDAMIAAWRQVHGVDAQS